MPYEGERPLTPIELQARGLTPPGPLSPPMDPQTPLTNEQAIKDKAQELSGLELVGKSLQMTGMGTQGQLIGKDPFHPTGKEVAAAAVPAVVGLLPQGRTFSRAGMQLGGNILGRSLVEGGAQAISPEEGQSIPKAMVAGGIKGVLPGIASAAGGALVGPSKGTIQAQKGIKAILDSDTSPNVKGVLTPQEPAGIYERSNLRQMQKQAGLNLDRMEEAVSQALGPMTFELPSKTVPTKYGPLATPQTFEEIRFEIKRLRNLGERPYAQGPLGVTGKTNREYLKEAHQLTDELMQAMRDKGLGKYAEMYENATGQYARDKETIRFVQAKQKQRAMPGGATPEDRPDIAKAEQAMSVQSPIGPLAHGGVGILELLKGSFFAPYNLMRALGQGNPSKPVAAQAPGIGSKIMGPALGMGTEIGQEYLMGST